MRNESFFTEIDKTYIDRNGHMNYKKYIALLEKASDDFFTKLGIDVENIGPMFGLKTVVRAVSIEYAGEIFEGDTPTIKTFCERTGKSSFTLKQEIFNNGKEVTHYAITIVMLDKDNKPAPIPDEILAKLKQ